MSAIPVFLRSETPARDVPRHSASKNLALLVLASSAAKWTDVTKTAIQLLTVETWRQVKDRVRRVPLLQRGMPQLAPADSYHSCMMLQYPPAGQESNARELQRRVWERAVRF